VPGIVKKSNISNKNSTPQPNFDVSVQEAQERINFFNTEFPKLGQEFFAFMQNKILVSNKGPQEKNYETQLLRKISMLAEQMNIDETQKESAGSMALLTIVLIVLRDLRDRMNSLEFEYYEKNMILEKRIQDLEKKNV
jgi:hypothetical protein